MEEKYLQGIYRVYSFLLLSQKIFEIDLWAGAYHLAECLGCVVLLE